MKNIFNVINITSNSAISGTYSISSGNALALKHTQYHGTVLGLPGNDCTTKELVKCWVLLKQISRVFRRNVDIALLLLTFP